MRYLLPGQFVADENQACSFTFVDRDHAIRHADSILDILHSAAMPGRHFREQIGSFNKHLPWLIDSFEALNEEQKRWTGHGDYAPASLLQKAIDLAHSPFGSDDIVLRKLDAIIVLLSADVAHHLNQHNDSGPADKRTLAFALVHLASAATKQRPISKLVAAQLLKPLDCLIFGTQSHDDGDLRVSGLVFTRWASLLT